MNTLAGYAHDAVSLYKCSVCGEVFQDYPIHMEPYVCDACFEAGNTAVEIDVSEWCEE